ncbi:hypothetical protein IGI04_035659, partial [Brassica rapa subsp. trilocularis]
YWSTTWSSWRHLEAFGAQKGVFRVVIGRARHGSDQSGATPPSRSDLPIRATLPERQGEVARVLVTRRRENEHGATSRSDTARSLPKPGATLPERQGDVARVFITRRRENEPRATSRSDTARSLPKPGATYRSDGLRSLRLLFLLELVISQGPFGATKRRIIFVLRKNHQKPLESDLFESIDQFIIEILCSYLFPVFLYMINLKSNMGLRGIMEINHSYFLASRVNIKHLLSWPLTNEHSSRRRVCLGLCPSLSSKLDHPRSNPYIPEFSFPIVKKEELCFINNNGSWYKKEPNFQYNNYQHKSYSNNQQSGYQPRNNQQGSYQPQQNPPPGFNNKGNHSSQQQSNPSTSTPQVSSTDALLKQILESQTRSEKHVGYELKNLHSKIDGSYNELNNNWERRSHSDQSRSLALATFCAPKTPSERPLGAST